MQWNVEWGYKNTLFVAAALAAIVIVPIPQTACSAISRVFGTPRYVIARDCALVLVVVLNLWYLGDQLARAL